MPSQSSREIELIGPEYSALLVVSAGLQPQVKASSTRVLVERNIEAPLEFKAIGSYRIDLINCVGLDDLPLATAPGAIATHQNDIVEKNSPLALNSREPCPDIEDKVVPLRTDWARHTNAKSGRRVDNRRFSDRSFLIRCHTRQHTNPIGWAVAVLDTRDTATIQPAQKGHTSL